MQAKRNSGQYRWLVGSLCVWLLCAGVAQQPAPAKKQQPKAGLRSGVVDTQTRRAATTRPVKQGPVRAGGSKTTVPADSVTSGAMQFDPESGLALDKNLILVKGQCTACHSSKLILQSHFDREKWIERIRWMQHTQKLWDLGESEPAILTYLTTYYGPPKTPFDGRRLPLAAPAWYKSAGRQGRP